MGDEPLNPDLPKERLKQVLGAKEVGETNTEKLYEKAKEKFNIYHIIVDDTRTSANYYQDRIESSWNPILGDRKKTSSIDGLANTIIECIDDALKQSKVKLNEQKETVSW